MRELLIVVADFYLPPEASVPATQSLRGVFSIARYGVASKVPYGWRSWLAAWLGRSDLIHAAPASIAAIVLNGRLSDQPGTQWLAEPIHLITGMRSVHLAHEGLLCLDAATQAQFLESFGREFADAPYTLSALPSGRFLVCGPPTLPLSTEDPARYLGCSIPSAAPGGEGSAGLKRLAAEIEMWLHDHPINVARARNRQRSISALWLWGGGAALEQCSAPSGSEGVKQTLFGNEPFVDGIARLTGARAAKAEHWSEVLHGTADHDRVAIIVEAFRLPERSSVSTPLQALEVVDREWIAPAFDATARGDVQRLALLANDQCLAVSSRDRFKFWRRPKGAFSARQ